MNRVCALGAELLRPAIVKRVELKSGGEQRVVLADDRAVRARWVVDASGVAALLARAACWAVVTRSAAILPPM